MSRKGARLMLLALLLANSGVARAQSSLAPSGELPPLDSLTGDDVLVERPLDPRARAAMEARLAMHPWERYVRGYREGHHFALSAGVSSGVWYVKHLGSINDKDFENSGAFARFQYSFHLPIYAGLGYMLGSSFGYQYEAVDERRSFRPVSAYIFPGLVAGMTLNINPVFRIGVAAEASLERLNGLEVRDEPEGATKVFVTMQAYDFSAFIDIFYELNWALRIEAHRRELEYIKPFNASGFPVDANLRKSDRWLGLGLVYHLL